ncbi:glutathione peroxidase [Lampropedia aestuarii]|uniref:Glutathione peroxidase n=1 Tax=Lampropedia aestuarii TaxID=2562762 RepID=A0A4S5BSA0_9BURK|nr:glutathione peroxidase [Lampropedia aestuarii]MDH5859021.1 glutathione peroxidase [Lampropedia aestuarii]THJ32768.1 glutathione peroxidase [Lampropedia aestuarii]
MSARSANPEATSVFDFTVTHRNGEAYALRAHQGQVLLIVNTASQCGFTPQLAGLEQLWQNYRQAGLVVLGFPCNQFRRQEPLDNAGIASFCKRNYGVTFPVMDKLDVNGAGADPLFQWLGQQQRGLFGNRRIQWNFTKFLLNRQGQVLARYAPLTKPEHLAGAVETALHS